MNRDDIISMAKKAGAKKTYHRFSGNISYTMLSEDIERFAALVAAAEREACAQILDSVDNYANPMTANDCAAAIRARGREMTESRSFEDVYKAQTERIAQLEHELAALRERLASWDALERMADNARELGLDYDEPVKEKNT